jgi:predicted acetyltransferase
VELRRAHFEELDQIYNMGMDAWSDGASRDQYLKDCLNSSKYKAGKWFVLSDSSNLLSSLIVYDFGSKVFGIGSIATPREVRRRGYASTLIRLVISDIERNHAEAAIFLYSDIQPEFYEKFGFVRLCQKAQKYETTICMVRSCEFERFEQDISSSPPYF